MAKLGWLQLLFMSIHYGYAMHCMLQGSNREIQGKTEYCLKKFHLYQDIKILDIDTGTQALPQGEDGEIAICGPQVMQGYWNRPDENEKVFREVDGNRYFLTGDIGHVDEDGYILITDRKKDMILVGGFNVYPRDVEDILFQHPKVALAAVVGVPDDKSGEIVKAYIELKPDESATEEEILEFCKENMAGYKRPKIVEFRETLPVSNVGKILRRVLRDEELEKTK